jgi:hypothetical protein
MLRSLPPRAWILAAAFSCCCHALNAAETPNSHGWPQAAGPAGTWRVHDASAPIRWSVTRNQNIVWRCALPNGGQSGIAVWGDRLFLTTFDSLQPGEKFSGNILGHCVDANSGKMLWSVKLSGPTPSPVLYAYSDSTSPTPVTDGKYVWFFNNSGEMGCWNFEGREIWRRSFEPWGKPYPFNKQHEPMLFEGVLVNVEPPAGNPQEKFGWNYLCGIDAHTG